MDDLRTWIRDGIKDGRLPNVDCLVTWFGFGRGEVCVACAARILGSEVVVECDLPEDNTVLFHGRCYNLWLSVRQA